MANGQENTASALSRKKIGIRLLYTLMYLLIFSIVNMLVQVTVLFQYVYLLLTQSYSRPLRNFSNKLAAYAYKIIRYVTLNDNVRPFPFEDFPEGMEKPVDRVIYD